MKRLARLAGMALAIIAGGFFAWRASQAMHGVDLAALWGWRSALGCAALLVCCMVQAPLTAWAWRGMLAALGVRLEGGQAYAILATTQLAKYLPGNVAQHLGRVALARRLGADLPRLAVSLVYENAIALLVGALLAALFLLGAPPDAVDRWLPSADRRLLLPATAVAALAVLFGLPRLLSWRGRGGAATAVSFQLPVARIAQAFCVFLINFAVLGVGFGVLLQSLAPQAPVGLLPCIGAFAAAWVLGMLAPGAPAGLGIREGVLLVLLGDAVPPSDGVTAIVLLRIATTLADVIHFWLGSWCLVRASHEPA